MKWIEYLELEIDSYYLLNSDTKELMNNVEKLYKKGYRVIALGNNASKRLTKRQIKHFLMDHPSPLNRKLNLADYEQSKLKELKTYLSS